ncbi:dalmatian isoform X2 [Musca autumnalis]|uniref:dalmatian isoform X2 n=1 Tax=Musca autumnalis TaxID=221902 RepID=UPI003CEC0F93
MAKVKLTSRKSSKKSSTAKKNIKELTAIAEMEDEKLASSLSQIENPSLDQEKRQAFSKLSLTKRKSLTSDVSNSEEHENEAKQKELKEKMVANEVDENGNKTEESKQSKETLESNTKPIRNTRRQQSAKQLKLTEMKNIANMSKIHFVPQTNSTMVFEHFIDLNEPERNIEIVNRKDNNNKDNNNNENCNNVEKGNEEGKRGRPRAKNLDGSKEPTKTERQVPLMSVRRTSRRRQNSKENVSHEEYEAMQMQENVSNDTETNMQTRRTRRQNIKERVSQKQDKAILKQNNVAHEQENHSKTKQITKLSTRSAVRNQTCENVVPVKTIVNRVANEHNSNQTNNHDKHKGNINKSENIENSIEIHENSVPTAAASKAEVPRTKTILASKKNITSKTANNQSPPDNNQDKLKGNLNKSENVENSIEIQETSVPTAAASKAEVPPTKTILASKKNITSKTANNQSPPNIERVTSINDATGTTASTFNDINASSPTHSLQNTNKLPPQNSSKTHKFFHRNNGSHANVATKTTANKNIGALKKTQRVRSSQVKREQIYEFLSQSQSQTSDSEGGSGCRFVKPADPMEDVIKKLIEEGKVVVAKKLKGKGRTRIKPTNAKPKKMQNKVKFKAKERGGTVKQNTNAKKKMVGDNTNAGHNIPPTTNNTKAQQMIGNNRNDDDNDDHFAPHFMDDDDDYDLGNADVDVDYNLNKSSSQQISSIPPVVANSDHPEGTFSNLAKSVLINQAGQAGRRSADAQKIKAQRLLAMAKKIISTPKNVKTPPLQAALNVDFSPIPWPNKRPATKASPWRIDEDANLPRVFNFSRSTGNLPSFSSDYIPPTPRKETPKNRSSLPELQETPNVEPPIQQEQPQFDSPLPAIPIQLSASSTPLPPNVPNISVPSSFSSNDSNAENQPPPRPTNEQTPNENEDIFNLKQLPNPRRALTYRSPLKAINILEVVHLPPLQKSFLEKSQQEMLGLKELPANDDNNFKTPQKPTKNKKTKTKSPKRDLFGFEEFLSQTDMSSQESDTEQQPLIRQDQRQTHKEKTIPSLTDNNIHNKLTNLRKLRPDGLEESFQQQQPQIGKLPNLFNEVGIENNNKGQKSIKQMLCSTMIDERPSTSKKAMEELRLRNLPPKAAGFNCATNFNSNISELFKDPEPEETTFNEDEAHRTYIRPYKRKRRLRENKLVFVLDSDESEDEDGNHSKSPQKRKNRNKHQNSHETDTSSEQQKPAKRKRKCKENPELKTFVEEFQEMCKEVESFEMIVEKSA